MPTTTTVTESKSVSSGNAYHVAGGDGLIVSEGVFLATSGSTSSCIYAAGSNAITINGAVCGNFGVGLNGFSKLTIGINGLSSGASSGVYAGAGDIIDNRGTIFGNFAGISATESGAFTLSNSGKIICSSTSGNYGISVLLSGVYRTDNSGIIKAEKSGAYSYFSDNASAVDIVTNTGTMIGNVSLGGGNDVFKTYDGRVVGTIDGGAGADKIYGSAYADRLTGGTENDTFYFRTKITSSAVDRITDFTHTKDDIALSKALFKLDPGQTVAAAFQDITAGLNKQGENKHILYNHDTGRLYYDKDGKGGAAPIHFATLDNHPTINSNDILMV